MALTETRAAAHRPAATPRVLLPLQATPMAPPALGLVRQQRGGHTMGTHWQVQWYGPEHAPAGPHLTAALQQVLDTVIAQMSPWQADTVISHYNRAPAGRWIELPEDFLTVLRGALTVAEDSDGAFDPCAGPLVDAWGFGPGPRHDAPGFRPPDARDRARAQAAAPHGSWRRLRLDGTRLLQPGGIRLDFSAIAKGHAVDRLVQTLQAAGIAHALVDIGGELRGIGLRGDGQPWWVGLEAPPAAHADAGGPTPTRIGLHGLAVATSGDYRRCYTDADGRHRAHTLDLRTGQPADHGVASVSVVHASCMQADAWSTALMALPWPEGLALARLYGLAALWRLRDPAGGLHEQLSPALAALAA